MKILKFFKMEQEPQAIDKAERGRRLIELFVKYSYLFPDEGGNPIGVYGESEAQVDGFVLDLVKGQVRKIKENGAVSKDEKERAAQLDAYVKEIEEVLGTPEKETPGKQAA